MTPPPSPWPASEPATQQARVCAPVTHAEARRRGEDCPSASPRLRVTKPNRHRPLHAGDPFLVGCQIGSPGSRKKARPGDDGMWGGMGCSAPPRLRVNLQGAPLQTLSVRPICSRYVPTDQQPNTVSRPCPAAEGARPVRRGAPHQNSGEQLYCRSLANPLTAQEKPSRSAPRQPQRLASRPAKRRLPGLLQGPEGSNGSVGAQARRLRRLDPVTSARRPEPGRLRRATGGAPSHGRRLGSALGTPR